MSRLARRVSLLLVVALIPSASYASEEPITALAPVELLAAGLGTLWGIAVDSAGNVYVADRDAGTVTRIASDQGRVLVAVGLDRPTGLAFDLDGQLLIAEEGAGRVVRVEADGRRTPVMSDVKQPRWLAVSEMGRLFVSARRLTRDGDPEPDDESAEPEMIITVGGDGQPGIFADGFKQLQGLATGEGVVYAATRGRREDTQADGVVFQIPILADGSAGPPTRLGASDTFKRPIGLARDRLGALYLTTKELDLEEDRSKRAVGKLHHDGRVTPFASNLDDPQGLAFDPDGNLYVVDGRSGRVVRFRVPRPPSLDAHPAYTNQATVDVRGTTEPAARIDVFLNDAATSVVGAVDAGGAFVVSVTLAPNAEHVLEILATGHAGDGLTSPPAEARITHDGLPPSLAFEAPPTGGFVRQTVPVAARAGDNGSGLTWLALSVGPQALGGIVAPTLPAPAAAVTATWNTATGADGTQTLVATAADQAGNSATVSRTVIVDNTAPDTQITGGPAGTAQAISVTFTFTGTDNLTPAASLAFAWRLDGGPWSAFDSATSATIAGLAQGPHLFEVKARDLAGNEDPSPAQQSVTVGGLQVTITEPVDGSTVPAGMLLVRGAVEAGGVEVGVAVNGVPAAAQDGIFAALVPVAPGTGVVLMAVGTASGGGTASHTIMVTVSGAGQTAELFALPQSGLAPLTVGFTLTGGSGTTVSLDADGDGTVDFTGPALDGQAFTYARAGLYFPVAMIIDSQGNQVTARTVVQVYDRAATDAFFKTKWNTMKGALTRNDIEGGVGHFAAGQQDRYRKLFTALGADIARIVQDMQEIELIYVTESWAKYRLLRTQLWGGQLMTLAYYVYFVQDGSRFWTIESF